MAKSYVKFDVPKELSNKVLQLVESAKNTGKLRKGTNEATKAIEKGQAQLVVIAQDVEPEEVVMHLPGLCEEKKVPYAYVPTKTDLGRAMGIDVGSAAVAITDAGEGKNTLGDVVAQLSKLKSN